MTISRDLYFSQPQALVLPQRSLDKIIPFHKPALSLVLAHLAQVSMKEGCSMSFVPSPLDGEPEIFRKILQKFSPVREFPPSLKNIVTDIFATKGQHLLVFSGEEKRGRNRAAKDWEKNYEPLLSHPRFAAYKSRFSKVESSNEWDSPAQAVLLTGQSLDRIKTSSHFYKIKQDLFSDFDPNRTNRDSWFSFMKEQFETGGGFSSHMISEWPLPNSSRLTLTSVSLLGELTFSETSFVRNTCLAISGLIARASKPLHVRLASPSLSLTSLVGEAIYREFYITKAIASFDLSIVNKVMAPNLSFLSLLDSRSGNSLFVSLMGFPDIQMVLIEQKG